MGTGSLMRVYVLSFEFGGEPGLLRPKECSISSRTFESSEALQIV